MSSHALPSQVHGTDELTAEWRCNECSDGSRGEWAHDTCVVVRQARWHAITMNHEVRVVLSPYLDEDVAPLAASQTGAQL
jgi:hypothetical protein